MVEHKVEHKMQKTGRRTGGKNSGLGQERPAVPHGFKLFIEKRSTHDREYFRANCYLRNLNC